MSKRILVYLCLMALLSISLPVVSAQTQYKIHFNTIVCLNPWNTNIKGDSWIDLTYPINMEFINAAAGKPPHPQKVEFADLTRREESNKSIAADGETTVRHFANMSLASFPHNLMAESRFQAPSLLGQANSNENDRFYITYKNTARQGMVLPVRGGDKDMFRFAFWKPTAAEGNPALAGGDSITYYLWEADVASSDNALGSFSINLKEKKGKGPQLVQIARGSKGPILWKSAVYIIEYEVK